MINDIGMINLHFMSSLEISLYHLEWAFERD